jgi:hypothetical protein
VLIRGGGFSKTLAIVLLGAKYVLLPVATEFALDAGLADIWLSLTGQAVFTLFFLVGAKILNEMTS